MVIEAARNLAGIPEANSAEFEPGTPDPVIATMAGQVAAVAGEADLGGTMRLGAYPATLVPRSIVAQAYGTTSVSERHRHRYEVNNAYRERLEAAGLVVSGESPDGRLVEFVELPGRRPPVLRGDPGASRTEVPPDARTPAVHGVHRRCVGVQRRGAAAGRHPRVRRERHRTLARRCHWHAGRRRARRPVRGRPVMPDEDDYEVVDSESIFEGRIVSSLRRDSVRMPEGTISAA